MTNPSPQKTLPFKELVTLMALFVAITALSIDTILPALSIIGKDQGVTDINHTQYIIGILFLGFTFGQLLYGPISDSFGRKPSIYIGLVIFIIGSIISFLSNSFTTMLVGRFFQGMGAASPRINCITIVRDQYRGREMSRVMSFVMAVFIFVPVIAPTIGELIIFLSNWRVIFLFLIIVALVAMTWAYIRLPETLKKEDIRPFNLKSIWIGVCAVLHNKTTIGYTVCTGLIFGVLVGYVSSARQIFQDYFNTGTHFVLYFAVSALSIGAAAVVNSMIVRKLGMRKICHYALIGVIIPSLLFLPIVITNPYHTELWKFMIYAPVIFFCMGLLFGNLNALAMEPMGHIAGIASAVIGFLSSAISVLIGTAIGQSYNSTLTPIITGFLLIGVIVFIIQFYLARTTEEECIPPME